MPRQLKARHLESHSWTLPSKIENASQKHAHEVDIATLCKIVLIASGQCILVAHLVAFAKVAPARAHTRRVGIIHRLIVQVRIVIILITTAALACYLTFEQALIVAGAERPLN